MTPTLPSHFQPTDRLRSVCRTAPKQACPYAVLSSPLGRAPVVFDYGKSPFLSTGAKRVLRSLLSSVFA